MWLETVCLPAVAAVFGVRYSIVSYVVCSVCSCMSQQVLSARDGGRSRKKHNSRRCSELSQRNARGCCGFISGIHGEHPFTNVPVALAVT